MLVSSQCKLVCRSTSSLFVYIYDVDQLNFELTDDVCNEQREYTKTSLMEK